LRGSRQITFELKRFVSGFFANKPSLFLEAKDLIKDEIGDRPLAGGDKAQVR
jgi:hypothetical protein